MGAIFRELAAKRECRIEEGYMMGNHVHMVISIPPKYAVAHKYFAAQMMGYIKGKSSIHIAWNFIGRRQNFTGEYFWARGYYVSTVGRDEKTIREYIRKQEEEDKRLDQLQLWK